MSKRNYIIVNTADNPTRSENQEIEVMENRVADKARQGYVPIGGIGVRTGGADGVYFVQAMVLKKFMGGLFGGGD